MMRPHAIIGGTVLLAAMCIAPLLASAYSESTYYSEPYYQGYYQGYYQPYYQAYYQPYYQAYYQPSYTGSSAPLAANTTFQLMCSISSGGSVSAQTSVTVVPRPCVTGAGSAGSSCSTQCKVQSTVTQVSPGQTTTLSWCCPAGSPTITNSGPESTVVTPGSSSSGTATVGGGSYSLYCASGSGTNNITIDSVTPVIGTLTANPTRVRRGNQTSLSWTTYSMASCALTDSSNTTISTALNSTGTSVTVNSQQVFTLRCIPTAAPATPVVRTVNVGILPSFEEI